MSETNSLQSLEAATGPTRPPDGDAPKTLDAASDSLLETLGVGGTGEVYRYADDAQARGQEAGSGMAACGGAGGVGRADQLHAAGVA